MNYQTLKTYTQGLLSSFKNMSKKDWNENDPTSNKYIKNRPFFTDDGTEDLILYSQDVREAYNTTENFICYRYEYREVDKPSILIVNDNRMKYEPLYIDGCYYFGNYNIYNEYYKECYGHPDSNYDIIITKFPSEMLTMNFFIMFDSWDIHIYCLSQTNLNYIALVKEQEKIHHLDSKYLDKSIARTSDLDNKLALSAIDPRGEGSFAVGIYVNANGSASHAEGYWTNADGFYSHAEGCTTDAIGYASHAEGYSTEVNGDYSHAEGYNTKANGDFSHVQGKYNIVDLDNKYAHIVGNGSNWSKRSNAHTLDWDGNAWFAGDVYVGSENTRLAKINEIPSMDNYYTKKEVTDYHSELEAYTDRQVAALVNSAPETLDTIGELAAAFEENQDMVATLNAAIVNKANKNEIPTKMSQLEKDISFISYNENTRILEFGIKNFDNTNNNTQNYTIIDNGVGDITLISDDISINDDENGNVTLLNATLTEYNQGEIIITE